MQEYMGQPLNGNGVEAVKRAMWQARLSFEIMQKGGRSVVGTSCQCGPLTIQSPFYPEASGLCHLYILHPPAGVVGGDSLELEVVAREGAEVLLTTPGATKFYRSNGARAVQRQMLTISTGASLEWLPQENIFHADADALVETVVNLRGAARFLGWEIHCLGLPAAKVGFGRGRARLGLSVYREGKPLLLEAMRVAPEKGRFQAAFLQNLPVVGSMIATGASAKSLEQLRSALGGRAEGRWAATMLGDLLMLRYVGKSSAEARRLFLDAWMLLRPSLLGRAAVPPRIWAT